MEVKVQEKINKPLSEVFEGIADPQKLSSYFTTRASGRIEEGKTLIWSWADYNAELSVEIEKVIPNQLIVFAWSASGIKTRVEITFEPIDAKSTLVQVTESSWNLDDEGALGQCLEQCRGWTHMLLCLKGFLEFHINLRHGKTG